MVVVIGTEYICSCKSNYHVIKTSTASRLNFDQFYSAKRYYCCQHSYNNREQEIFDYIYPLDVIIDYIHPLDVIIDYIYPLDVIIHYIYPLDVIFDYIYPLDVIFDYIYPLDVIIIYVGFTILLICPKLLNSLEDNKISELSLTE